MEEIKASTIEETKRKETVKGFKGKERGLKQNPTLRQRKAVLLLASGTKSAKEALVEAGFSASTAKNPGKALSASGFQVLLEDLGLTDAFLGKALLDDIKNKPGRRVEELKLGFKVKGRLQSEQNIGVNFIQHVSASRSKYDL